MTFTTDADIRRIADGIRDLSLPKPEWTHEAHWAAAVWLLSERGPAAVREMPGIIRVYNEACGVANTDTGGYHETITLASLRAGRAELDRAPEGEALAATLGRLLAGPLGRSDWLLAYWSREALFSVAARRRWVEPNVRALPF